MTIKVRDKQTKIAPDKQNNILTIRQTRIYRQKDGLTGKRKKYDTKYNSTIYDDDIEGKNYNGK